METIKYNNVELIEKEQLFGCEGCYFWKAEPPVNCSQLVISHPEFQCVEKCVIFIQKPADLPTP